MIDTHCHLYTEEFDSDIEDVIEKAELIGVKKFYLPAIDKSFTGRMNALELKYPDKCFAMAGLHPCSVKENYLEEVAHIKWQLTQRKFCGIGETGLDFYWDKTFITQQYQALEIQIELALQYDIPLILHTRNALQETIEVIKKYKQTELKGIFHCFGGSIGQANEIIKTGFYMGIGGVLTYKNAGLPNVLANIDMKHIVLETDAPYLTPVPFRGKRNESSYLKYIVEKIAEVKNISVEEVEGVTTENAEKIFAV
jgi:TatD DNase family protein